MRAMRECSVSRLCVRPRAVGAKSRHRRGADTQSSISRQLSNKTIIYAAAGGGAAAAPYAIWCKMGLDAARGQDNCLRAMRSRAGGGDRVGQAHTQARDRCN